MLFAATELSDCVIIDVETHVDKRGFFARTFCVEEFREAELPVEFVQCSLSRNVSRGTLRGLHFQRPPSQEGKLVRCTRGAVYDVIVDLRADSNSYLRHVGVELSEENCRAVYIPPGCAHGFQTLFPDSDVFYQMTDVYAPELGAGLRWNDPALSIEWPIENPVMNRRDQDYPELDDEWLRSLKWTQ